MPSSFYGDMGDCDVFFPLDPIQDWDSTPIPTPESILESLSGLSVDERAPYAEGSQIMKMSTLRRKTEVDGLFLTLPPVDETKVKEQKPADVEKLVAIDKFLHDKLHQAYLTTGNDGQKVEDETTVESRRYLIRKTNSIGDILREIRKIANITSNHRDLLIARYELQRLEKNAITVAEEMLHKLKDLDNA